MRTVGRELDTVDISTRIHYPDRDERDLGKTGNWVRRKFA